MAKVIEIKTPNCSRCKQFEPEYVKIQEKHPENEYIALVFGQDEEAAKLATTYGIRAAPTFIVESRIAPTNDIEVKVVKPEELSDYLDSLNG